MMLHFLRVFFSGSVCPIIGMVSMDYVVVKLPADYMHTREFCIMADDYNDVTSAAALAICASTSTTEICIRLANRLPRLYEYNGVVKETVHPFTCFKEWSNI